MFFVFFIVLFYNATSIIRLDNKSTYITGTFSFFDRKCVIAPANAKRRSISHAEVNLDQVNDVNIYLHVQWGVESTLHHQVGSPVPRQSKLKSPARGSDPKQNISWVAGDLWNGFYSIGLCCDVVFLLTRMASGLCQVCHRIQNHMKPPKRLASNNCFLEMWGGCLYGGASPELKTQHTEALPISTCMCICKLY